MRIFSTILFIIVTYFNVNAFPDYLEDFPMPIFNEPEYNNCKIFESDDMRLWIRVEDHLYEIKYLVHSYACDCMSIN